MNDGEAKMTEKLEPFQKVLVRQSADRPWEISFFGRMCGSSYFCVGVAYDFCIPYEGNEYLLGATASPDAEFEWWEHVEVRDKAEDSWRRAIYVGDGTCLHPYAVVEVSCSSPSVWKFCRKANW